ncbi:phosphate regulon sensor histidine kinase PhoR [Aliivibrio sp. S3MY1]|uniref:phosphate regulon sensor histidine kinase PhoR n=1 Tax=unclassified Aliivibrio TaxID=2645654 RepID=UPI00237974B0|nr:MULTISPECIES: phosphate regulon sensor histidine kinase PhoR [unclassified Aliivibrio]MDD9196183.1 phosphate regulon sensor histidine kinase PhoR [Aliivibrio sp. S3MY1]MDD9199556.1 phosphate regulon sensor histidine kinase PhoR [Aliivibrio sp. S2MY1]
MVERLSWKKLVGELAFFYVPWVIVGYLFDALWPLLFLASFILLIWHLHNQIKMSRWLHEGRKATPPSASGSWEPIFDETYRLQKRHKKRRKELSTLIRRFRQGAEALPDAVVVFRHEGNIVWCNSLAQSLLGFRWPDDSGHPITNLIRTPDFVQYLMAQQFDMPLDMPSPINTDKTLEIRIVPYSDGEFLMVVRDVTQVKQLEGMRRNFFANVSHELRTPMTVLRGYLEMSEDPEMLVGPMWNRAHGVMTEQLSRMEGLVEQLLTLSKIEAAATSQLEDHVDVPSMLDILEKEAIALSGERNHSIRFDVDPRLKVLGDEDQLRSAISNLVYNAVKHTTDGADIVVEWQVTNLGAKLSVKDGGQGIEPQHIPRLTERFYRVDKARSRDTGGSGLGLAIVKHALSHHDSQLEIQSQLGKGSIFSFVLPKKLILK